MAFEIIKLTYLSCSLLTTLQTHISTISNKSQSRRRRVYEGTHQTGTILQQIQFRRGWYIHPSNWQVTAANTNQHQA